MANKENDPNGICGYSASGDFGVVASTNLQTLFNRIMEMIQESHPVNISIKSFTNQEGDAAFEKHKKHII